MLKYTKYVKRGDKMNKYFLVPVTSKNVKLNGMILKDILKEVDLELYNREEERLVLTYGHEKDPKKIIRTGE